MNKTPFTTWLLVWLPAQAVSLVTAVLLFTLGLILIEFLLYPLALGITALLTGLTAVSFSNSQIDDGLHTPVNAVVLRCEVAAAVLGILLIVASFAGLSRFPPIFSAAAASTVLALVAAATAIRLRFPPVADPHQTRRVLLWLLLAFLAIPAVIFIASLFGWAGA